MIKSIIVDDEPHCVRSLMSDLQKHCSAVEVVESCGSAKEGMMAIKKMRLSNLKLL